MLTEFTVAAEFTEGALWHDAGEPIFTRYTRQSDHWKRHRLGWLWAHYESWEKRRPGLEWHRFEYRLLGYRVLAVASLNLAIGKWRAYIDAAPGESHENEWLDVAMYGSKLPEDVAEKIFPEFARQFEWEK